MILCRKKERKTGFSYSSQGWIGVRIKSVLWKTKTEKKAKSLDIMN